MTLATIKGRLQTKLLTYVVLALITAAFVWHGGSVYMEIWAVAVLVGLVLESIWGKYIVHEPGWLTIALAGVEFMAITAVATLMGVPVTFAQAARYYIISWIIIQLFVIYILPVWRLNWNNEGSELW